MQRCHQAVIPNGVQFRLTESLGVDAVSTGIGVSRAMQRLVNIAGKVDQELQLFGGSVRIETGGEGLADWNIATE